MDWEAWLRAAVGPSSEYEQEKRDRTEAEIRDALAEFTGLQDRDYAVYTKGSYANNTNVRLNYDVDIAVEYRGFFYYDIMFALDGWSRDEIGIEPSKDPYTRSQFKADIRAALVEAFGASAIEDGRVAYRVRQRKTTLPADVVPCWEYRRYDSLASGSPGYNEGSRIYPADGGYRNNYPKRQVKNGTAKNNRTGRRYKRIVRALKKLQSRLVEHGKLTEELPSYLTECLVYNVDDGAFGHALYKADIRAVLATIYNATLTDGDLADWTHVHELEYLFRGANDWTPEQVRKTAGAAWDELGFE